MSKSWAEMTPAERLADRIAKNREIEARVAQRPAPVKKGPKSASSATKEKASRNALDRFQEIKRTEGLDAAADFIRNRRG